MFRSLGSWTCRSYDEMMFFLKMMFRSLGSSTCWFYDKMMVVLQLLFRRSVSTHDHLHYTTLHSTTLQLQLHNYIPLHSTTLLKSAWPASHYDLWCLGFAAVEVYPQGPWLDSIRMQRWIPICCSARWQEIHYTTLRYTTLGYTRLHYLPLHFTTLLYTTLHYNYNYNCTTTLH